MMVYATLYLPSSYVTNLLHYHRIRQCFQRIQEIKKEMHFQPMFIMAYICQMTLCMPRILSTPTYVFRILQEACRITKGIPYGRARNGITMGWCHYTRTVCLCYTSVSSRWIIHGYILSHRVFASFILSSTMEDN